MAGEWIKFESVTPDKPEVYQMAEILGIDPDAVVGKLVRVWVWADQQTVDGHAPGVTRALLDRITSATGFAEALLSVGWLIDAEGGLSFPRFGDHNGNSAKKRAMAAKRSAKARKSRGERDAGVTTSVTSALPRVEKSREEKRRPEKKLSPPPAQVGDVEEIGPVRLTETVSGGGGDLKSDEETRSATGDQPVGATWQTITAELTAAGLNMAAEAAKSAKKHGATPGHCLAVLQFWRSHPGAWGVGIIYSRFTNPELCNLAPAAGWPTPAARVITTNSDNEARERQVAQFAEIDASKTRAAETRRELDQLAEEHGGDIDQLTNEEILELLPSGPARVAFERHGWRAELIRGRVLRAFVEKYLVEPVAS